MFLILSCDLDDTIVEDSNEEDDNNTSKRSSDWFFHGFFSFALFTRLSIRANGGGDIECLATGDIKAEDRKNSSRSAERKAILNAKNEERIIDLTGERGISLENKSLMKSIAIQERESILNEHSTRISITLERIKIKTKEMEMALQVAMKVSADFDENHPRWKKYFQLEEQLNELNEIIQEQESNVPVKHSFDESFKDHIKSENSTLSSLDLSEISTTSSKVDTKNKKKGTATPTTLDMSNVGSMDLAETPNASNKAHSKKAKVANTVPTTLNMSDFC